MPRCSPRDTSYSQLTRFDTYEPSCRPLAFATLQLCLPLLGSGAVFPYLGSGAGFPYLGSGADFLNSGSGAGFPYLGSGADFPHLDSDALPLSCPSRQPGHRTENCSSLEPYLPPPAGPTTACTCAHNSASSCCDSSSLVAADLGWWASDEAGDLVAAVRQANLGGLLDESRADAVGQLG